MADRSAALRAAVAGSSDTAVRVPSCPVCSLADLVEHITQVHFFWAGVVAGPSEEPPTGRITGASADLLGRSAEATGALLAALRDAGPDRGPLGVVGQLGRADDLGRGGAAPSAGGCSAGLRTPGDRGRPEPLPGDVGPDGVGERAGLSFGTAGAWSGRPARIVPYATEGASWVVA
ncbi:maleylpyruvate isomerase N-terminal domain-containing protein [Streptomyces sp. NBC_01497]|uniref:maleylpyruvate isomerase N-terminal domain-containing protein n=1 Tax=Streptomyces sp. NBC_01497 TaxID=2903885 RepID=UPI002E35EBF3|nr:maleylpyruvate isomerase N-terminal domain-containing protein [Streptomyces sp. NBC_01497]